jgi:spore coat protein JB
MMDEKDMLMRKIRAVDFALWETHLFLDTHPDDTEALALNAKYKKRRDTLVSEYESKFGPLDMSRVSSEKRWQWINEPWPWEYTKGVSDNVGL